MAVLEAGDTDIPFRAELGRTSKQDKMQQQQQQQQQEQQINRKVSGDDGGRKSRFYTTRRILRKDADSCSSAD